MNIVDVTALVAGLSLLAVGIVLLRRWTTRQKESFFYWGFGLCLWGAGVLIDVLRDLALLPTDSTVLFVRNYLIGLAFVFFILYGTLLFVLKKKQSNVIVGTYFIFFFIINVILNGYTDNVVVLSVWHNILFVTPPSLVFGVYFYYHFRSIRKLTVWLVYNLWIFFAVMAFSYTFIYSIGIANDTTLFVWSLINNIAIISITVTYLMLMFGESGVWHQITKSMDYVIDDDLRGFFEEYFYDRTDEVIRMEMERIGIQDLGSATKYQRMTFIDNCIKYHFSKILSFQRQEIVSAKLMSILGIKVENLIPLDYGQSLERM